MLPFPNKMPNAFCIFGENTWNTFLHGQISRAQIRSCFLRKVWLKNHLLYNAFLMRRIIKSGFFTRMYRSLKLRTMNINYMHSMGIWTKDALSLFAESFVVLHWVYLVKHEKAIQKILVGTFFKFSDLLCIYWKLLIGKFNLVN